MFDPAGLASWLRGAMEPPSETLVASKDRRDSSYAISHQPGNAGQTGVREADILDCSGKLHDPSKRDFRR
jgi:hypothetical protein